jgi:murein tripeptide amidase MpaA
MSWLSHSEYPAVMNALAALRADGQQFCWRFPVATSHERRTIYGLRIHRRRRGARAPRAVLIVGGAHAREMVPPEAVLLFADSVCHAYVNGNDFSFGGKTYPGAVAVWLVEALELFVVPLLNVDGRAWVETMDQGWRKNRRPHSSCPGVDLNRNYNFLFASGIGTSSNPCNYEVYRGPGAHSEPEVRGIRDLLDAHYNIRGVLDVHSFMGLILFPWGNDENQSSNPSMTFTNPVWDGQRGIRGDTYKEHIVTRDWDWYTKTANRMRDRVKEVAGRTYIAKQGFDLYPTSATLKDYPYSRHRANTLRPKILSMTVEIGFQSDGRFRPTPEAVAQTVRNEGAVLIVEFCLAIMCVGDAVLSSTAAAASVAASLRSFREELLKVPAGRRYIEWLESFGGETALRLADPAVARELPALLKAFRSWWEAREEPLDEELAERGARVLRTVRRGVSRELASAIDAALSDLKRMRSRSANATKTVIRGRVPTKGASRGRRKTRS